MPADRKAIGCKWVFKIKTDANDEPKYKARLVYQGFNQKYEKDYIEIFAPVVRQATLKFLLSVATSNNLIVNQFDAKTAFLNGELKESIYMKEPPGFSSEGNVNKICLLKRSIYGLKQSARVFNQALHDVIIKLGFIQSNFDACLNIVYTHTIKMI